MDDIKRLKINDDKTNFLLITSPQYRLHRGVQIEIGQARISTSTFCKNHWVVLDITWQWTNLSKVTSAQHSFISEIFIQYVPLSLSLQQANRCNCLQHHASITVICSGLVCLIVDLNIYNESRTSRQGSLITSISCLDIISISCLCSKPCIGCLSS